MFSDGLPHVSCEMEIHVDPKFETQTVVHGSLESQPWPVLTFWEKRNFELATYVPLWCSMEHLLYLLPWSSTFVQLSYGIVDLFSSLATHFRQEARK